MTTKLGEEEMGIKIQKIQRKQKPQKPREHKIA
jgi:hypothetical protein